MDAGFACGRVFNAEDTNRDGENLWSAAFPSHCNNGYFGDAYGRDDADTENQDEKPDMAFIPANFETLIYTVENLNTLDVETQQDKQREKNNETSYYILYNTTFNSSNST